MEAHRESKLKKALSVVGASLSLLPGTCLALTVHLTETTETQAALDPPGTNAAGKYTFLTDCSDCLNSNGLLLSIQRVVLPGTYDFKVGDKFTISYNPSTEIDPFANLIPQISGFQSDTGDFDDGESLVETLVAFNGSGGAPNRTDFTFTSSSGTSLDSSPSTPLSFVITSQPEVRAAPEPSTLILLLTGASCLIWWRSRMKRAER